MVAHASKSRGTVRTRLPELRQSDAELNARYGGKGLGLLKLKELVDRVRDILKGRGHEVDLQVPEFELFGADFYDSFREHNRDIIEQINGVRASDMTDEQKRKAIEEFVYQCTLSEENEREVEEKYARLGGIVKVRSSATCEDSFNKAYAGKFKSLDADSADMVKLNVAMIMADFMLVQATDPAIGDNEKMCLVMQQLVEPDAGGVMFSTIPESIHLEEPITHIEAVVGSLEAAVRGNSSTIVTTGIENGGVKVHKISYGFEHYPETISLRGEEPEYDLARRREQIHRLWHERTHPVYNEHAGTEELSPLTQNQIETATRVGKVLEEVFGYGVDIEFAFVNNTMHLVQIRPITGIDKPIEIDFDPEKLNPVAETPICVSYGTCTAPLVVLDSRYSRDSIEGLYVKARELDAGGRKDEAARLIADAEKLKQNLREIDERFAESGYILVVEEAARITIPWYSDLCSHRRAVIDPRFGSKTAHGSIETRQWSKGNPERFYLGIPGLLRKIEPWLLDSGIEGVRYSSINFMALSVGLEGMLVPLEREHTLAA